MSLSSGRGPLSAKPAGRFTTTIPPSVTYLEPHRRRVRGMRDGVAVIDSERALLVHREGHPPRYAFPAGVVHTVTSEPVGDAPGYVTVPWDAVDAWFEEDEEVLGGHPRNPYHRVDCLHSRRSLRVDAAGVTLVDTTETLAVYETALEPRLYVDPRFVRMEYLERSETETYCSYKGTATYWSARIDGVTLADVAWSYESPLSESAPLQHFLSFDDSKVTVVHNLPPPG